MVSKIKKTFRKINRRIKHIEKLHIIPIAILCVIILTGLGATIYKIHTIKTRPSPSPTPVLNQNTGWYIYTNLQYGFSFKYPSNFGGQGSISGPTTGTVNSIRSFTDPKTISNKPGSYFDGFSLYVVTDPKTASFDKYIAREIAAMNAAKSSNMVGPAKIQLSNGVELISKDGKQAYYYLPSSDKKTIVVFAYLESDPTFKETFDTILSSFKFSN